MLNKSVYHPRDATTSRPVQFMSSKRLLQLLMILGLHWGCSRRRSWLSMWTLFMGFWLWNGQIERVLGTFFVINWVIFTCNDFVDIIICLKPAEALWTRSIAGYRIVFHLRRLTVDLRSKELWLSFDRLRDPIIGCKRIPARPKRANGVFYLLSGGLR